MGLPDHGRRFLEGVTNQYSDGGKEENFDTLALQGITNISASHGQLTCDFLVSEKAQNRYGTLHGGCIATLVDVVGTAALLTQSTVSGVSLNLSVDYLTAMPGGETCTIIAKVLRSGGKIGTIDVTFQRKSDGRLTASGRHIKYLINYKPGTQEAPAGQRSKL